MPTSLKTLSKFPKTAVTNALQKELCGEARRVLKNQGKVVPASDGALVGQAVSIDSLAVVELLMAIEPIVGCELPERVVRAGGYESVQDALDHLLPGVEKIWSKAAP